MSSIIFNGIFGSKLYGTETPTSDVDYKAIFVPNSKEIIMGCKESFSQNTNNVKVNGLFTKNSADDIDREFFSLKYFINMAVKGETIAIDMIHTPDRLNLADANPVWQFIRDNRSKLYSTDMKAYLGYVKKQASKYGIKGSRLSALNKVRDWALKLPEVEAVTDLNKNQKSKNISFIDGVMHCDTKLGQFLDTAPIDLEFAFIDVVDGSTYYKVLNSAYQETLSVARFKKSIDLAWKNYGERARQAELNQGIDWKALHHAIRGGQQLQEIYKTGDLQYPLADRGYLLDIKQGKVNFKDVSEYLEHLIKDIDTLAIEASKNGMPSKPDVDFWNQFVYDTYLNEIKSNS